MYPYHNKIKKRIRDILADWDRQKGGNVNALHTGRVGGDGGG